PGRWSPLRLDTWDHLRLHLQRITKRIRQAAQFRLTKRGEPSGIVQVGRGARLPVLARYFARGMVRPAVLVALLLIILPVCILMVRRSLYAGGGSVTITGSVKTGTTAISGSAVTLYAAGDAYGSGASMLATAVSAGDGTFSLTFSCAGNQETYITATGGNAGQGSNSAIGLMAALGPCESLVSGTSSATINELTTAAAEWSLTQFLDSNGRILGAPPSNTLGLQNAYVGFSNLADINA